MKVVVVTEVPERRHTRDETTTSSRRGETISRPIFRDVAPDGLHFWFGYGGSAKTDNPFTAPRHHHALQQIRWCDSGSKNYAPGKNIEAGDLAYFPRGAYYGPENKAGPYVGFSTQFGFGNENMIGPYWRPIVRQAKQRLRERGTVADGMFTGIDPATGEQRRYDAVQAMYEQAAMLAGGTFTTPAAGYEEPILMHPAVFEYFEIAPGVEAKELGRFYDHPGPNADVHIQMIRLTEGGLYHLGADRAQIAICRSAGLHIEGGDRTTYPELTCIYSPRYDKAALSSESPLEICIVEYPRLD